MHLQIDIKPFRTPRASFEAWKMNQYINGSCYTSTIGDDVVQQMLKDGIIHQVQGERHNAKGDLEKFDYPEKVDGSGVQYTSNTFQLAPYQEA